MSVETEEQRGPLRWIAGAVAIIVALGIIGGLMYFRFAGKGSTNNPSVGSATINGVNFNCRLPVLGGAAAGFISFPDGAITVDHTVTFTNAKGAYGSTYDPQVKKWLPVPQSSLSPDGRSYAYLAQTTGVPGQMMTLSLHTHVISSGSDHVLWEGSASLNGSNAVTWLPDGIYFSAVLFSGDYPQGPSYPALYVSNPSKAGAPQRVGPNPPPQPPAANEYYYSGPDQFTFVGPGAAWGIGQRVPKQAPSPNTPPEPGTYGPDRILRMDLRDGSVTTWYTASGTSFVSLVGLDAKGEPILTVYEPTFYNKNAPPPTTYEPPPVTLLLLTGPNQTAQITAGSPAFHMGSQPAADSHGIWFGSWNEIWLYTTSGGLRQVATVPSGVFPSPTPPIGVPAKGVPASGVRQGPAMPAYMQGTLLSIAGPCA